MTLQGGGYYSHFTNWYIKLGTLSQIQQRGRSQREQESTAEIDLPKELPKAAYNREVFCYSTLRPFILTFHKCTPSEQSHT